MKNNESFLMRSFFLFTESLFVVAVMYFTAIFVSDNIPPYLSMIFNFNVADNMYYSIFSEIIVKYKLFASYAFATSLMLFVSELLIAGYLILRKQNKQALEIWDSLKHRLKFFAIVGFSVSFIFGMASSTTLLFNEISQSRSLYVVVENKVEKQSFEKSAQSDLYIFDSIFYQSRFGLSLGYKNKDEAEKEIDQFLEISEDPEKYNYINNLYKYIFIVNEEESITKDQALEIYENNDNVWLRCYEPNEISKGSIIELFTSEEEFKKRENMDCMYVNQHLINQIEEIFGEKL